MAKDLNKATFIGRVGRDPEIRYTQSGNPVATFSLATGFVWKDQSGEKRERTEWHRIVIWGPLAEVASKYVTKGMRLYLEGEVQYREWEDQDGNKRNTTEINCHDMIMLTYSDNSGGGASQDRPKSPPPQNKPSSGTSAPPPDDDIPF